MEFVILETKKLPAATDNTARWDWTKFFGSDTEAELRAVAKENERIAKAMLIVEKMSASEAEQYRADILELQELDYTSRIYEATQEGINEGIVKTAKRMKDEGLDTDLITKVTGLSESVIANM
jgi:predicted transposase/invertase (TIGR01784 family)